MINYTDRFIMINILHDKLPILIIKIEFNWSRVEKIINKCATVSVRQCFKLRDEKIQYLIFN